MQERGVLYAAGDVASALAESFQHTQRRILRTRGRPWLAAFELAAPCPLLDLGDAFAVRAGASMKLVSGPFSFAQNWARGFHECYPAIAGMRCHSSLTNRPVVVLSERADLDALVPRTPLLNRALDDPMLYPTLRSIAVEIGYRLI